MVIKKSSSTKSSNKSQTSSETTSEKVSSYSTSNPGGQTIVTKTTIVHPSSSVASSSSIKKSMSSEMKVFSTSSKTSSTSKSYVGSGGMQSRNDDFLRGERINPNIDGLHSTKVIESVDLQTVASDFENFGDMKNLVSVEIEESKTRVGGSSMQSSSSTNEVITNINTATDGNRSDVIGSFESGRNVIGSNTAGTTSYSSSDVKQSFQSSSSSSFMESKNGNVTNSGAVSSSKAKNLESSLTMKDGQIIDNKGFSDLNTTFTSKVFDDKTKTWVVVDQSSSNEKGMFLPAAGDYNNTNRLDSSKSQSVSISEVVDGKNNNNFSNSSMRSKNLESSFSTGDGYVIDNSGNSNLNTTFTSKVFDDNISTRVDDQSSTHEKFIFLPGAGDFNVDDSTQRMHFKSANDNFVNSSMTSSADNNFATSSSIDNKSSNISSSMRSDFNKNTSSTKEFTTTEKTLSNKIESARDEKLISTKSNETMQVFDSKTKSWKKIDESTFNKQKRPSYVRYRSQNEDGSWHTIYKRKLFDNFSKQWRVVEEKIIDNETGRGAENIPDMIENSTNITTTTYTTKVYDTKTGKWTVIEEKSYVDKEPLNVTQDIRREMEIDEADLANIITTTETTKVNNNSFFSLF